MPRLTSALSLASILCLPSALAAPQPDAPNCIASKPAYSYSITFHETIAGTSVVGDYTTSGGGQLTDQTTFTVGVTVEVGADLGLDFKTIAGEASAGFGVSVSYTTEHSATEGVADNCPDGAWYCALSITPTLVRISGMATTIGQNCGVGSESTPYTVTMPKLGSDALAMYEAETCTCMNLAHWADDGHAALLCPQDCALPGN